LSGEEREREGHPVARAGIWNEKFRVLCRGRRTREERREGFI
jgi:hypothetical protein